MKTLETPPLLRYIYNKNKNSITQYIGNSEGLTECTPLSTNPFTFNSKEGKVFITNDENADIPIDCKYALLNSRIVRKIDFQNDRLNLVKWLKHPQIKNSSTNEIVDSWNSVFTYQKENILQEELGLRPPQIGAIHSIMAHIQNADEKGIVVLPTGTGKTETMISVLVANQCEKVLVSVPSNSLRIQISDSFKKLGILRKLGVIPKDTDNPIVGVIQTKFKTEQEYKDFVEQCNVVITTMQILSELPKKIQENCTRDFSHFFIDEAHHSEAPSWKSFINIFPNSKVFLFTATPFRNDNKKLDGKIIFNFSLRKAQEQGYYKKINFIPIREYNKLDADRVIAETAVKHLKEDISTGFDHILMARCGTKERANEIFELYSKHPQFSPIIVYNGIANLAQKIESIKSKKHRIIICVDMLGEGFDLPQLKIAAIHDARQSIPIMLQFIGRFTRTSSSKIGDATFITNTAYPPIKEELNQLYNTGSDWNVLLPKFSDGITQKQVEFNEFLDGFVGVEKSQIPFHSIYPAMSVVVFKNKNQNWNPNNWRDGISNINQYEHQFSDVNESEKTIVIILGKTSKVEWGNFEVTKNINWEMITIHWDHREDRNLIFINTSYKTLAYKPLLKSVFGDDFIPIDGDTVFRVLHDLKRYTLYNFGGRKGIGRDISFQSFFGKNVEEGLHDLEQRKLEKNNVFGVGYRGGEMQSMGCSQKGKIWSYLRGNLKDFIHWCQEIGSKLIDETINTDTILSQTIKSVSISKRPEGKKPIYVDWHSKMYAFEEGKYEFRDINSGKTVTLANCELRVLDTPENENLKFIWSSDIGDSTFELQLEEFDERGTQRAKCEFLNISGLEIEVIQGSNKTSLYTFFNENAPVIYFHDTSYLQRTRYTVPKDPITEIDTSEFIEIDWATVDISKESMGFETINKNSIQYHFSQFIKSDYEIIFNDDNKGEMADLVAIKRDNNVIYFHLYHLKYAKEGKLTGRIDNFYELCGQAQKSLSWKHSERKRLFNHLLRRMKDKKRILKGDEALLEEIKENAVWEMEMEFEISIVQPGLSLSKITPGIITLISNTSYFLKTTGNVKLNVYIGKD